MSRTFTKLFSSITESTIWVKDLETRIVWITMLAMADRHGRVWGSIPGLANRARVTVKATEKALKVFLEPDEYSRTKEFDGRRIEPIDGGWRLLNYEKYRAIRDEESIRESKREWAAKHRSVKVDKDVDSRTRSTAVGAGRDNAEAEAEAEAEAGKRSSARKGSWPVPKDSDLMVTRILEAYPRPDFSQAAQAAVVAALDREAMKIESRTQAYASAVKRWPRGEGAFRYSCIKFFEGSLYRQDDACWERNDSEATPRQVEDAATRLKRERGE